MHVSTNRTKLYFSRNGKKIAVSWDKSFYDNKWLASSAEDIMLEIATRGENSDRLILKGVQQIMKKQSDNFEPYRGGKVNRGAYLTYKNKKSKESKTEKVDEECELKCKFKEKDREAVKQILQETLASFNIRPVTVSTIKKQVDEYYDTQDYMLATKKESLRVRESKNKIIGTYKTPKKSGITATSRNEMNIEVQENSAIALINGAKEQYGIDLPQDIDSVVQVENARTKQDYLSNGIPLEVAIDDVHNIDLKTGRKKHSDWGEFEIEFKDKVPPERAEELINKIYIEILRKCTQRGITIKKSEFNKYIDALLDLGIIKDPNKIKAICE